MVLLCRREAFEDHVVGVGFCGVPVGLGFGGPADDRHAGFAQLCGGGLGDDVQTQRQEGGLGLGDVLQGGVGHALLAGHGLVVAIGIAVQAAQNLRVVVGEPGV